MARDASISQRERALAILKTQGMARKLLAVVEKHGLKVLA